MKTLERILWIVVGIVAVLKVLRLPMSSLLLILGLSSLAMLYLLLAVLVLPSPDRRDQVVALSIVTGVVMSIACIAVLSKVQLWPLAAFHLMVAIAGLSIVLVVSLASRSSRPALQPYFKGLFLRVVPILVVCVILSMVSAEGLMAFYTNSSFNT